MNTEDLKNKNLVICDFIHDLTNCEVKPEYSTSNRNNEDLIVVQEQLGEKIVLFDALPLFNYYSIDIFANSIRKAKNTSVEIGNLIGKNILFNWNNNQKWQIIIKQFSNPRPIMYEDIKRVSYSLTLQVILNRVA